MSDFSLEGFQAANKVRVGVSEKKSAGKAVAYDLKYRDGSFSPSAGKWKELDLDNKAMKIFVHPVTKQVALQVVENDLGTIYKRTAKTGDKKFHKAKAPSIETALVETGLITKTEKVKGVSGSDQYLSLLDKGNGIYVIAAASAAPVATPAESSPAVNPVPSAPEVPAQTEQAYVAPEQPATIDQIPSSDELLGYEEDATGTTEETTNEVEDEDFDEKF